MAIHIRSGAPIIIGVGNGSGYDEFQGYIRAIQSTPQGPDEPTVNATYNDGVGGANQANNLRNIEVADLGANEDYWRAQSPVNISDSRPFTNTRPSQGDIVWVAIYNAVEQEHFFYLGFVRAVIGPPIDQTPVLNVSYYNTDDEVDNNLNNLIPFVELAGSVSYWADFKGELN